MAEELSVKGIILSAAPQGEYGRRLVLLTDQLGKITVFANGAAKSSSHIIGVVRPMTCAVFQLMRGRSAWNLHGVELIESFDGLQQDYDRMLYGMYVLELASYEAQEGMHETEAKAMLNLMYVTLLELAKGGLSPRLIRRVYELRILKLAGEYTDTPPTDAGGDAVRLWQVVLTKPLSKLFEPFEAPENKDCIERFCREAAHLFARQVPQEFHTARLLEEADSLCAGKKHNNKVYY